MKNKLGVITIGQSPRTDVVPEMARCFSSEVEILERGALDAYGVEEIGRFAPDPGMFQLVTRLRDGQEVIVGKEKIMGLIEGAVKELNRCGVDLILLLCNGQFPRFPSDCLIVQPQRLVNNCISGLLNRENRLGVLVPVEGQVDWARESFKGVVGDSVVAVASPYSDREALEVACAEFEKKECDLVVLYCMGFNQSLGQLVREICSIPVIVSSSMVSRILGELLTTGEQ